MGTEKLGMSEEPSNLSSFTLSTSKETPPHENSIYGQAREIRTILFPQNLQKNSL